MDESPVLLHVWDVNPDEEDAATRKLDEMFGELVKDPGFVSARVLASGDQTSIAAVIEMRSPEDRLRSPEDRRRIEQQPDIKEILEHLHGAANIVIRLYEQVAEYGG